MKITVLIEMCTPDFKMNLQNINSNFVLTGTVSESLLHCWYRHHTVASIVNHSKLLFQLHCIIKLFNLYVYLLNSAGVHCAQCIHVQASKGVVVVLYMPGLARWLTPRRSSCGSTLFIIIYLFNYLSIFVLLLLLLSSFFASSSGFIFFLG